MKNYPIFVLFFAILHAACAPPTGSGKPGFRVRSDFTAALNANQGWAGALNEDVTVFADCPFRIRFEVESHAETAADQQFRLEYRRNGGSWTNVEAHDFPHPEREISMEFEDEKTGRPIGWNVVKGDSKKLVIETDSHENVLRAQAEQEPLVALFTSPWETTEMVSQFRLTPDNQEGMAFVIGYADINNYCLVLLHPSPGSIRVSRVVDGITTTLAETDAVIPLGPWLDIEIEAQARKIEVNFQNDLLEIEAELETDIPLTKLGFLAPPGSVIEFKEFEFSGEAKTPRVSIVTCAAFERGMLTSDLLKGSAAPFQAGTGINFAEWTPVWSGEKSHGEFEWPVVIRRFADGAVTNEEGDAFEFRMVDAEDNAVEIEDNPVLQLSIPAGHVGGTYIENPGRIGPWQASNGDLYFMMEPAETDNVFMMIKSTDNGRTWHEVDAAHRPQTNDLESVHSQFVGDTIHILHQVTESALYHTFRTSDHPMHPDTWAIRDEPAGFVEAVAQTASMVVRSDGSIVAFYLGQEKIHYSIRSADGTWGQVRTIDPDLEVNQAGPQTVLGANDVIHLAYYETDGTIWYRQFLPDGTLTPRQQLAAGAGASRAEYGAVLPLLFNPQKDEVIIIYRLATAHLWERRVVKNTLTDAVKITEQKVITDAVDSQQAGADAILDGDTTYVLFIEESSRSIFSTNDKGGWQPAKLLVDNILGSWVRGNAYTRHDGVKVYGYIYDAGSDGGSGMNRFSELILGEN